jgi:PAS domain S-box-containing protein
VHTAPPADPPSAAADPTGALPSCGPLLRALLRHSGQALAAVDRHGRVTGLNPAFETLFGSRAAGMPPLTLADLATGDDREPLYEGLQDLFQGRSDRLRRRLLLLRRDGGGFEGELTLVPIDGARRQVRSVLAMVAAVAGARRMQLALQEREALVQALYDKAAQAIASTDDRGRFIEINPAFERMFGYTRQEALRLTHLEITHPDDTPQSARLAAALFRRETDAYRIEKRYVRKDGSVFWGDVSITAVHKPGQPVQSVSVIVDISDRKRAEEQLQRAHDELERHVAERTAELAETNQQLRREITRRTRTQQALKQSEERFRAIFETATDCVFIKDPALRYVLVNPRMLSLLDLPASRVIGARDEELFDSEAARHLRQVDLRVLAGQTIEEEHRRPIRGNPMTFLDIRAPMRDAGGQVTGICGISRDITERRKTRAAPIYSGYDYPSAAMQATLAQARTAARTEAIVLLTGESGSGKDHLARYIHECSGRAGGPFYAINCAAIPAELAESELFGHESGAYTGARRRKRGLLELAEGGTLLLNEIGELPLPLQAKLLTFLDTRTFTRVGGETSVTVNARLLAATNRRLVEEVAKGRFREDLYYRLNVLSIRVPPLRQRHEDLPLLVHRMLAQLAGELQLDTAPGVPEAELETLARYSWPGNVRELRNALERAMIVAEGTGLKFDFLESPVSADAQTSGWSVPFPPNPSLPQAVAQIRRRLVQEALARSGGRQQEAARLLGVSRFTLRRQLKALGLDVRKPHIMP